jgi:hypothetical protein
MFEMKLVLAKSLSRFQLSLSERCLVQPIEGEITRITIMPSDEMPVIVNSQRLSPQFQTN